MKTSSLVAVLFLAMTAGAAHAQMAGAQMPDVRQMSGIPLPTPDLPAGTLTVRVLQGALDKPILGTTVELTGDASMRASTGESGRAEFTGLKAGARIRAVTLVNGERLETQDITMPPNAGIRVMLVATDPDLEKRQEEDRKLAAGPAQRGTVVLGGESRFVFELGDGGLNVFNIFQVLNTARVPVDPGAPVVFELPETAEHAALMQGSSSLASVAGKRVEVRGPFPPGVSLVQFAYTMPYSSDSLTVRQVLPVRLTQLTVIAQKVGQMHVTSPQMAQHVEREADGQRYILGQGPAVAAGGAVEFAFSGLPHAPTWPRNLALTLVVLILAAGAYFSAGGPRSTATAERQRLEARRESLFADLTALEHGYREGRIAPAAYASRRQHLIASLERVYAALDEEAAA